MAIKTNWCIDFLRLRLMSLIVEFLYQFKGIGEFNFFTKNNIGSYIKALSTNYKPVFMELKNLI